MNIFRLIAILVLLTILSGCSAFRKENPLNVKCPSCGYEWDYSIQR